MSAATTEEPPLLEPPASGDAAFAALMDVLVPDQDAEAPAAGGAPADAAAAGGGQSAPAPQGTGAAAGTAGAPAAGGGGQQPAPAGGGAADTGAAGGAAGAADTTAGADTGATPGAPASAAGGVDAATLAPQWGKISTALEESDARAHQTAALTEVRTEFPEYFDALEVHPRLLVGRTVPRVGAEGTETLRDSTDAKEWQEAVKTVLVQEIKDRAVRKAEASGDGLRVLHASIELFQNNPDLIPGTRQFDRELADRVAVLAQPYEHRVDGKLHGYTIPVQPLVTQLRATLAAERAAKSVQAPPAAQAAPAAVQAVQAAPVVEAPQAGIPSKAGAGADQEDYSVLFGTIGLPNLRI